MDGPPESEHPDGHVTRQLDGAGTGAAPAAAGIGRALGIGVGEGSGGCVGCTAKIKQCIVARQTGRPHRRAHSLAEHAGRIADNSGIAATV